MPNRFASVLIASVLFAVPAAALAQSQPAPATAPAAKPAESTTVAPIIVEAAPKPKVIEKQTHSFVQSYAAVPNAEIDQIGRWRDPVCVQVLGLPADQGAPIKARIEDVAQAVGLPKANAACEANVEIVFTDRPQAMMDDVAKRREQLLGYAHRHDRDKLKTVTHPIQAWYLTATLGGGGDIGGVLFQPGSPIPGGVQVHREVIDDPDNPPPIGCGDNPRITGCLRSTFKNVFVVADTKALEGKELGLLADYLAMITLSQPKSLDACYPLVSVIDVLAKACAGRDIPDGLTPGDAAYLTALYAAHLEAKKASEQSDIANRMAKILVKAAAGGR